MARLPDALRDWKSVAFAETLQRELEQLPPGTLPLLKGVAHGGLPNERDKQVMVLSFIDRQDSIQARVGVFFSEVMAGCSCGDEPVPLQAYCEIQVKIHKATAEAQFAVLG
jgi:hypothetical protein